MMTNGRLIDAEVSKLGIEPPLGDGGDRGPGGGKHGQKRFGRRLVELPLTVRSLFLVCRV